MEFDTLTTQPCVCVCVCVCRHQTEVYACGVRCGAVFVQFILVCLPRGASRPQHWPPVSPIRASREPVDHSSSSLLQYGQTANRPRSKHALMDFDLQPNSHMQP